MASLKLTVFVMVALAYASTVHCDDEILDLVKENVNEGVSKAKEVVDSTTEAKGLFDSFKEKVSGYYEKAVEKGKETFKATADAVSSQYEKIKDKAKEFIEKKSESTTTSPITDQNPL